MADSKMFGRGVLDGQGLMVQAMAFRVKYRKLNHDGYHQKLMLQVRDMGVHRRNRCGVYPSGIRCKSLCEETLASGWLQEELNHACVVVEDTPIDAVLECMANGKMTNQDPYTSGSQYNAQKCGNDELLASCFQAPYENVRYSMLSHNHMMLVMRAFITGAKWNIPAIPADAVKGTQGVTFCDEFGGLSVAAVAATPNGKELAEVLSDGVSCEVLSWKMDIEEPEAASIISAALNQPASLAMLTTELTAIALLKGEIMFQMGRGASECVAFRTVRDRVRAQLHNAADDPDLVEIFDFLISAGVGTNSYVDHLLEWTGVYVDSKKRQLRFGAFAVLNKMPPKAKWSQIAVAKRAYRKTPVNGYCASPEAAWGELGWPCLETLEELLRFFHVVCKDDYVDKMTPQSRATTLANIDIAAANALWAHASTKSSKSSKLKAGDEKTQELLLEAVKKYLPSMGLDWMLDDPRPTDRIAGAPKWIRFWNVTNAGAAVAAPAAAGDIDISPAVIKFDEATGNQLNTQLDFVATTNSGHNKKAKQSDTPIPWRAWFQEEGVRAHASAGAEADKSVAVMALESVHANFAIQKEPIHLWRRAGNVVVVATHKVSKHTIMLPPCIPLKSKVFEQSEHPQAVEIMVSVLRPHTADESKELGPEETVDSRKIVRQVKFFVHPEFKAPPDMRTPAVAEAVDSDSDAVADEPTWDWTPGDITMHPFWAVRRMTLKQLASARAHASGQGVSDQLLPRFNCAMEVQTVSAVTMGIVKSSSFATTRVCEVPFMTNSVEVEVGEELIMMVTEKEKSKEVPKRNWKDVHKAQEVAAAVKRLRPAVAETTTRSAFQAAQAQKRLLVFGNNPDKD